MADIPIVTRGNINQLSYLRGLTLFVWLVSVVYTSWGYTQVGLLQPMTWVVYLCLTFIIWGFCHQEERYILCWSNIAMENPWRKWRFFNRNTASNDFFCFFSSLRFLFFPPEGFWDVSWGATSSRENPKIEWMRTGGPPILGNLHMVKNTMKSLFSIV